MAQMIRKELTSTIQTKSGMPVQRHAGAAQRHDRHDQVERGGDRAGAQD